MKPCPFCGATNAAYDGIDTSAVFCPNCSAAGPDVLYDEKQSEQQRQQEAERLWDQRA